MRLAALLIAAAACAGCLGSPASDDASANAMDMPRMPDLRYVDYAGDYDCVELNQCLEPCQNQLCVDACIQMATPTAVQTQKAVQQCFNQYCPTSAGGICAPDSMGMMSTLCQVCLANSQASQSTACNPTDAPECHQCLMQVTACRNDQA